MLNSYIKEKDGDNVSKDRMADLNTTIKQGEERLRSTLSDVEKRITQGKEQIKNVAADVNKNLHENPWPIVAGVAAGCVLLGFMMGFNKKSN